MEERFPVHTKFTFKEINLDSLLFGLKKRDTHTRMEIAFNTDKLGANTFNNEHISSVN